MSTAQRSTERSPDRRRSPDMNRSATTFGGAVAVAGILAMAVSIKQTWWVYEWVGRLGRLPGGGAALAVEIATACSPR